MRQAHILIAAGVLTAVVATAAGCSSPSEAPRSAKVALEGVGVVGDKPFLRDPRSDLRGVTSLPGGGETAGDARGAFGGTRRTSQCDKAQLIGQLTADPVKAKAWAHLRGIDDRTIGPYIRGLTSVVLLHDTLVKNHNYEGDGRTYAYLSVLQAGVAVLVDPYGSPAVKCNCGNPLGRPDTPAKPSYQGVRWEGFQGATVTVIRPRPTEQGPLASIPLVDPYEKSRAFDRTVGNDGTHDSKPFSWTPPTVTPPGSPAPSRGTPAAPPTGSPEVTGSPSRGAVTSPGGATEGLRTPGSPGTPGPGSAATPESPAAQPSASQRDSVPSPSRSAPKSVVPPTREASRSPRAATPHPPGEDSGPPRHSAPRTPELTPSSAHTTPALPTAPAPTHNTSGPTRPVTPHTPEHHAQPPPHTPSNPSRPVTPHSPEDAPPPVHKAPAPPSAPAGPAEPTPPG
ncbi:DUF6777 domain-containing protein [Streptomyces sp. NPDC052396]|uniref:DUF6777 domain-containing protein n=1 Tax=Streptomyces sp. NPDC052396 TaxID=3365689 RepID=UPI0037D49541